MNSLNKMTYYLHHTGYNIPKTPKIKITFNHLTFVLEGSITYTANGKEYRLEKNDAILLPTGTYRERLQIHDKVTYVIFNYHTANGQEPKDTIFFKNAIKQEIKTIIINALKIVFNLYRSTICKLLSNQDKTFSIWFFSIISEPLLFEFVCCVVSISQNIFNSLFDNFSHFFESGSKSIITLIYSFLPCSFWIISWMFKTI